MTLYQQLLAASTCRRDVPHRGDCVSAESRSRGAEKIKQAAYLRFETAMKDKGWQSVRTIKEALGSSPTSGINTLRLYMKAGWVQQRPRNGEHFNRNAGWEFLWIGKTK